MFLRLFRMACVLGSVLWVNACSFNYFAGADEVYLTSKQLHAKLLWHKNPADGPATTWNRPGGLTGTAKYDYPTYWVAQEWHGSGARNVIVVAQLNPEDDSVYETVYPNMWEYNGDTFRFNTSKLYFEVDTNDSWTGRLLTSGLEPLSSYTP